MFFIKWIATFLKSLNSNEKPDEIAAGIAFGFVLALIPSGNLLWILLLLVTFFLRVNWGMEMIFLVIFKLIAPVFDPILHPLGYALLIIPSLEGFYDKLYNIPLIPFTKFNNTIVMGSFAAGILLYIPIFILFKILVQLYRTKVIKVIAESKFVKWFMKLPVVSTIVSLFNKANSVYSRAK
jgi:uncharacterized protein (TIGR03546 family)